MTTVSRALAIGFWLWCIAITIGGGFLGSLLNCDESSKCKDGSPSWAEPWTWGDYDVYPAALVIGVMGLVAATACVIWVFKRARFGAWISFACSILLLSYPLFAGLTFQGRVLLGLGPLLGLGALLLMRPD